MNQITLKQLILYIFHLTSIMTKLHAGTSKNCKLRNYVEKKLKDQFTCTTKSNSTHRREEVPFTPLEQAKDELGLSLPWICIATTENDVCNNKVVALCLEQTLAKGPQTLSKWLHEAALLGTVSELPEVDLTVSAAVVLHVKAHHLLVRGEGNAKLLENGLMLLAQRRDICEEVCRLKTNSKLINWKDMSHILSKLGTEESTLWIQGALDNKYFEAEMADAVGIDIGEEFKLLVPSTLYQILERVDAVDTTRFTSEEDQFSTEESLRAHVKYLEKRLLALEEAKQYHDNRKFLERCAAHDDINYYHLEKLYKDPTVSIEIKLAVMKVVKRYEGTLANLEKDFHVMVAAEVARRMSVNEPGSDTNVDM